MGGIVARPRDARRQRATASSASAAWCGVEPRVAVEVSFSELMLGRLRDPVLRALRPSRTPGTRRSQRARSRRDQPPTRRTTLLPTSCSTRAFLSRSINTSPTRNLTRSTMERTSNRPSDCCLSMPQVPRQNVAPTYEWLMGTRTCGAPRLPPSRISSGRTREPSPNADALLCRDLLECGGGLHLNGY